MRNSLGAADWINSNALVRNSVAGQSRPHEGPQRYEHPEQQGVVLRTRMGNNRFQRGLHRRLVVVGGQRARKNLFEGCSGQIGAVVAQRGDDRLTNCVSSA